MRHQDNIFCVLQFASKGTTKKNFRLLPCKFSGTSSSLGGPKGIISISSVVEPGMKDRKKKQMNFYDNHKEKKSYKCS